MRSRSIVHMLNVFAQRLEIDNAPKATVEAIKLFALDRTIRSAERRDWNAQEEKRQERQRTLFAMLPSSNAVDRLKETMLQRAYDLLWDGDPLGCDALIEFLPSAAVDKMMKAWCEDQDGNEPRSDFYKARTDT